MRLIDADKLMADDTFCEGIECDMCSLSYIDDVYHCRACGVTKWIINQPTVCDIEQSAILLRKLYEEYEHTLEQIRAEITEIRDSWEKDCYQDEADALTLALKIIDRYTKGAEE